VTMDFGPTVKHRHVIVSALVPGTMFRRLIVGCMFLVVLAALPVLVFGSGANSPPTAVSDFGTLKPGEFIWHPELAPSGPMRIVIYLHTQLAYVYRNGVRIGVTTISSGKPGHRTPMGTFSILEKERFHRSTKYSNAPMPYMQRLTWYGIALHGGHLPGHPASHGCVRLPYAFAEALFKETSVGMRVIITDRPTQENPIISSTMDPRTGVQSCEPG
jgi:hypothetical protein